MQSLRNRPRMVRSDRWLLSYADFVTLLFAVFAVFFLIERSVRYTGGQVFDAVARPHRAEVPTRTPPAKGTPAGEPAEKSAQVETALAAASRALITDLREEIAKGKVDVRMEPRGLVIGLGQGAFFQSGRAEVDPGAYATIDRLGTIISRVPNPVRLEGHTDNVRIQNSRFKNNWELSAARSIAMLELLAERNGISRNRLSIAGFADTAPLTSNQDPGGRARNRRVEVILVNSISGPDQAVSR